MKPIIHEILLKIVDPVERQDQIEKFEERLAICLHDGVLRFDAALVVAEADLIRFAERKGIDLNRPVPQGKLF